MKNEKLKNEITRIQKLKKQIKQIETNPRIKYKNNPYNTQKINLTSNTHFLPLEFYGFDKEKFSQVITREVVEKTIDDYEMDSIKEISKNGNKHD